MTSSLVALAAALGVAVADDTRGEYGGYVSNEETRFQDYVWDFLEEMGTDCTAWLGCTDLQSSWINESFTRSQYYWGSCAHLLGSSRSYVDSVDIAYVAGHGNASLISMAGTSCDLTNASWGRFATSGVGDLETIVLHSCKILQMDTDWRSRWRRTSATQARPFSGLHHALGFRTNHNHGLGAGTWASDEFAENLEDGYNVRTGWYNAVESAYWLSPWAVYVEGDNKQAVFYMRDAANETASSLLGSSNDVNYGSSSYILDAYYRQ